jgi:Zn-dependent protease with chaperone function
VKCATRQEAAEFILHWVRHRQGSPSDLIRALEEEAGWPGRLMLPSILDELRARRGMPDAERKFLFYTLNAGAVAEALADGADPPHTHESSIDDLLARSRRFWKSAKYGEAVEFLAKFRDYSPFNNMLVYAQNPLATQFATASHWRKAFGRTVKENARAMIILAPHRPVLMVYDIADTDGPPLPKKLRVFTQTSGPFNPALLHRLVKNCERDRIQVRRQPMGDLQGGFATSRTREPDWKMRVILRDDLKDADAYAVLCHELAHVYLGHVSADRDGQWPFRVNLSEAVAEIEAESVAHIVCARAGLRTHSAEYLSSFVEEWENTEAISLDLVSRVASKLLEMSERLLKPRFEEEG